MYLRAQLAVAFAYWWLVLAGSTIVAVGSVAPFIDPEAHFGKPDSTQNLPGSPEAGRPDFSGVWRCATTDSRGSHYATLYVPWLFVQDRSTLTVRLASQDGLMYNLNGTVNEATSDFWQIYQFDGRAVSAERPAHRVYHSFWERDKLVTITTEGFRSGYRHSRYYEGDRMVTYLEKLNSRAGDWEKESCLRLK